MTLEQKVQTIRQRLLEVKSGKNVPEKLHFKEVAKKAGINPMTLQRYITTGTINLENLQKICDVIDLDIIIQPKN